MTQQDLTLVVMAAGLGTRFGGAKQLESVGPNGETFADFAIQDALEAGVGRVVLIVRSEIEAEMRERFGDRYGEADIEHVLQDRLSPKKGALLGTAHAVMCVGSVVDGPFVVCNADDFYGRATFAAMIPRARDIVGGRGLVAGFRLGSTLPAAGKVSRGICTLRADEIESIVGTHPAVHRTRARHMSREGEVESIVETHGIRRLSDGTVVADDPPGTISPEAVVSMNFWAFTPDIFSAIEIKFAKHMQLSPTNSPKELHLPTVVNELIAEGELNVEMIPTSGPWIGVTNREDLTIARQQIAELRGSE